MQKKAYSYSNLDLYMGKDMPDLSLDALLSEVPAKGGHCYQHSELMLAALQHLGFDVTRVACCVLMGQPYVEGTPQTHSILMVKIAGDTYMCDPGFGFAAPRFPVKLNMVKSEEFHLSDGDEYKFEVAPDHYNFYWKSKEGWFILIRFERNKQTGWAETVDREATLSMCRNVYQSPGLIPIRDKLVHLARHTDDSRIDFSFIGGDYAMKIYRKGQLVEKRTGLDHRTFFELANKFCKLNIDPIELPLKKNQPKLPT